MTNPRITVLTFLVTIGISCYEAVVVKSQRENFNTYGPPPPSQPAPQYGPPSPQHQPHREYGVPQKIPFREYGPPALKYGPPKFISASSGSNSQSSSNINSLKVGFNEQIKYFGVPKPFYGPPLIQHKPASNYGPPQAQYGPPPRPSVKHGPLPLKQLSQYGPPLQPPQSLPSTLPAFFSKPEHSPASSYGPPPSGPLNIPSKQFYGPPQSSYGPPPLPLDTSGSGPASSSFNKVPETTIILTSGSGSLGGHQQSGAAGGPVKQVQIQIDTSGHTHSISGSQAPFHTACDGWKPISAHTGYVEGNIETQSGYSQVAQGSLGTQYRGSGSSSSNFGRGSNIVGGLTNEQLVAVVLESGNFDTKTREGSSGDGGDYRQQSLNSIETGELQMAFGIKDDSYNKPPPDSYAPGSIHAQKYNNIDDVDELSPLPKTNYVPPAGIDSYGPPPSGSYLPPSQTNENYGPSATLGDNYGPPPPLPQPAAFVQKNQQSFSSASTSQTGLHYGTQSGNVLNFPPHGASQPNRPVTYRPPVPQGLLESIGATVKHLDQFGMKPPSQSHTYIPPAANEIATNELGNVRSKYGPPPLSQPAQLNVPIGVIEQQLPQHQPPQSFVQVNQKQRQNAQNTHHLHPHHHRQKQQQQQLPPQFYQPQSSLQQFPPLPPTLPQSQLQYLPPLQEQHNNDISHNGPQLLPPPPPPPPHPQQQQQYLPPPLPIQAQQVNPFPELPPPPSQEYLPPTNTGPVTFKLHNSASSTSNFENIYASSQHSEQFLHPQGALLKQQTERFTQEHNCGQGPNLVTANYQLQYQDQQQNSLSNTISSNSANAYNAISQSIPVAEKHTQFIEQEPSDSFELPPFRNNDFDGYASQKSPVSALPDDTNPMDLPGLDSLNVISAQKSQSIQFSPDQISGAPHSQHQQSFVLDIAANEKSQQATQTAHHEEILSEGLLQSILTAIEQPQSKGVQHQHSVQVITNRQNDIYSSGAQSRSDTSTEDHENEPDVAESHNNELQLNTNEEEVATFKENKPIVPQEIDEEPEKH